MGSELLWFIFVRSKTSETSKSFLVFGVSLGSVFWFPWGRVIIWISALVRHPLVNSVLVSTCTFYSSRHRHNMWCIRQHTLERDLHTFLLIDSHWAATLHLFLSLITAYSITDKAHRMWAYRNIVSHARTHTHTDTHTLSASPASCCPPVVSPRSLHPVFAWEVSHYDSYHYCPSRAFFAFSVC